MKPIEELHVYVTSLEILQREIRKLEEEYEDLLRITERMVDNMDVEVYRDPRGYHIHTCMFCDNKLFVNLPIERDWEYKYWKHEYECKNCKAERERRHKHNEEEEVEYL